MPDFFNNEFTPVYRFKRLRNVTDNTEVVLPKGVSLRRIVVRNNTANAVTGGIRIGTAAGGAQVLAATPVAANAVLGNVTPLIDALNATAFRTLYLEAVTAWNDAALDIVLEYAEILQQPDRPVSGAYPQRNDK